MSMVCKICSDPNRLEIDRAIVQNGNLSKIAKKYNVPYGSLYSHAQEHLSRQLVQALERKGIAESMNLMNRIDHILISAEKIFERNYAVGKDRTALKALGEQRSTIELLAKISAYLHEARAMELQRQQGSYESRRAEEDKEFAVQVCDNLSEAEIKVYTALLEKANGAINDSLIEFDGPSWKCIPKIVYSKWNEPRTMLSEELYQEIEEEYQEEPVQVQGPTKKKMKRTRFPKDKYKVQSIEPVKIEPYSKTPKRVRVR